MNGQRDQEGLGVGGWEWGLTAGLSESGLRMELVNAGTESEEEGAARGWKPEGEGLDSPLQLPKGGC